MSNLSKRIELFNNSNNIFIKNDDNNNNNNNNDDIDSEELIDSLKMIEILMNYDTNIDETILIVDKWKNKINNEVKQKLKDIKEFYSKEFNNSFRMEHKSNVMYNIKLNLKIFNIIYNILTNKGNVYYLFLFYLLYVNFDSLSGYIKDNIKDETKRKNFKLVSLKWEEELYDSMMSNIIALINKNRYNDVLNILKNFTYDLIVVYKTNM